LSKRTKRLSMLVMAIFCFSIAAGWGCAPAQAAVELTDISDNWAFSQIFYLVDRGVIAGYADGTFRPNNPISRAEFITITNRAFGYANTSTIDYTDVKTSDWFYGEIAKAKAAGYIAGFSDGSMRPGSQISRQEVAAIIARVLNLDTSSAGQLNFTDADSIPDWSRNAIAAMVKASYLSGYPDGNFRAANAISRAEAAVIISLAIGNRVAVSAVTLDKPAVVVAEGESATLTAAITPADASNQRVLWSSADRSVAIVSTTGTVTGISAGKTGVTVTTSDGGFMDTCQVTVVAPVAVTGVSLSPPSLILTTGFTGTLTASVLPAEATNRTVLWASSDPAVAFVDSNGVVTAVAPGSTFISARTLDGGYISVSQVTVNAPVKAAGIMLNKPSASITVGYSEVLVATIVPPETTDKGVSWSSSAPLIASVNGNGTVTALAAGSAIITARTNDGGFTSKCNVTVTSPIPVTSVSLDQKQLDLKVGETAVLEASVSPSDATNINVDWSSTDLNVAAVSDGLVTAVGPGLATIMVRTQDGGKTAICDVSITAP
jgi:uncharacterized protein YjdB